MRYLRVPREITLADLKAKDTSWSAGMYRRVEIPASNTFAIRDLIAGYDKGSDPGSMYYMEKSTHHFIRTKSLQAHSYLISSKGGAITPINPRVFEDMSLTDGDILLSKDSNIGECAMVDGATWRNHTLSGGIVRLRPSINRHYLFGFLKHELFKTELLSMVPRGATIAHANKLWLDCRIPFPGQRDANEVVTYVAALTEVVVEKEKRSAPGTTKSTHRLKLSWRPTKRARHSNTPTRHWMTYAPRPGSTQGFIAGVSALSSIV